MGRLLNIVTPLHRMTKRDYIGRMQDEKVHCMLKAKEYEADYWDGDRRYGYGGYRYIEGRWKPVAQALIDLHGLKGKVRILDVGCGKGYLLREFKLLLPEAELAAFYHALYSSERGHYKAFLSLAQKVTDQADIRRRWREMLVSESCTLAEQEPGPRIHSGVPRPNG